VPWADTGQTSPSLRTTTSEQELRSHAYDDASGASGIGTCRGACSACPDGWRRQTGLHSRRSAPAFSRRMLTGAGAFRRERCFTTFGATPKRQSRRWKIRSQRTTRGEGPGNEQQAKGCEPENEGDEDQHQKGPGALRLRLAVFAAKLTPHLPQVRR